jgi:hypothetical protein
VKGDAQVLRHKGLFAVQPLIMAQFIGLRGFSLKSIHTMVKGE